MDFTVDGLTALAADLPAILSPSLYERAMQGVKPAYTLKMADQILEEARAHPLGLAIRDFLGNVDLAIEQDRMAFSNRVPFLFDLIAALTVLKTDGERAHFQRKLSNKRGYHSALFELFIYASYSSLNDDIRIVPERPGEGVRTPDFEIVSEGKSIFVECKSIEDDLDRESAAWATVELRIMKLLRKFHDGWLVDISAKRELSHEEGVEISKFVFDALREGRPTVSLDSCDIGIYRLAKFGEYITASFRLPRDDDQDLFIEADVHVGAQFAKRPRAVRVRKFARLDQSARIIENITSARGQIDPSSASIVHLQIPYKLASYFQRVLDNTYGQVFERLQAMRDSPTLVAITGRFVDRQVEDGGYPIRTHHSFVPKHNASSPLPSEFLPLGIHGDETLAAMFGDPAHEGGAKKYEMGPGGTILVKYALHSPLSKSPGRWLWQYKSPDAQKQIMVWQSFNNEFAVDIVHPEIGHLKYRADMNRLPIGVMKIIAVGWSSSGIVCFIDKDPIPNGESYTPT